MARDSDVKRFVTYLNQLSLKSNATADHQPQELSAASTDFTETQQLLVKFEEDERVRNVLLDSSEQTLHATLQSVEEALQQVENKSISAYIEEASR